MSSTLLLTLSDLSLENADTVAKTYTKLSSANHLAAVIKAMTGGAPGEGLNQRAHIAEWLYNVKPRRCTEN